MDPQILNRRFDEVRRMTPNQIHLLFVKSKQKDIATARHRKALPKPQWITDPVGAVANMRAEYRRKQEVAVG